MREGEDKRQSAEQKAGRSAGQSTNLQYAVGIDPGSTGAVVILEAETKRCVFVADFEEDLDDISLFLKAHRPSFAVVERQQYMAKGGRAQGAKSAFSLGENYGLWKGLLQGLDIPFQTVPPIAWQKYVFGSGTVCGDTKERSIRMAMRLLPDLPLVPAGGRTQRHGRSDAGLLALYAAAVIRKRGAV